MPVEYTVEVQPAALHDMEVAVAYIANELKSPAAAEKLAERLVQGIESLAKLPSRCPLHRTTLPLRHEYRQLLVGSYLVFFTVSEQDETVTVARVLYAGPNLDKQREQPK